MTAKEILEAHCPSMSDLYLGSQERIFRDRIIQAMEQYASEEIGKSAKVRCGDIPEMPIEDRRLLMARETWILNVMRVLGKSREEAEKLYVKIQQG